MVDESGIGFSRRIKPPGIGRCVPALQAGSPVLPEPDSIDQVAAAMVTETIAGLAQTHISGNCKTRCHTETIYRSLFIQAAARKTHNLALKGSPLSRTVLAPSAGEAGQRFQTRLYPRLPHGRKGAANGLQVMAKVDKRGGGGA